MRTTLLPGMLESLARNSNHRTGQARFFEVGNVHFDTGEELPEERKIVGLILYGEDEDFFSLKGTIETLLDVLGIQNAVYATDKRPYWQPGCAATVCAPDGMPIGRFGTLHPDAIASYGIKARVYAAELSFSALLSLASEGCQFTPLPRYPLAERDLAVVVERDAASDIFRRVIEKANTGVLIENVRLFDSYEGTGVPSGQKSLAFSFTLRSDDHTLSEDELRQAMDTIIEALRQAGAPLRGHSV